MKVFLIFADEAAEILTFAEYGEFGSFFVVLYVGDELIAEPVFVHPRQHIPGISCKKSG